MANTLVDISGNGKDHAVLNGVSTVDGIMFDQASGSGTSIARTDLGNVYTIAFRLKQLSVSGVPFSDGGVSDYVRLNTGTSQITHRGSSGTAAVWDTGIVPQNEWMDVVIVRNNTAATAYENGVSLGAAVISGDFAYTGFANYGTFPFKGIIEDFRVYSTIWTAQQVQDYHNSFARRPVLVEDFSLDAVGTAVPQGWQKGTGTYEIKELAAQDSVLKHLDVGTKYLECTSAGTIAIPSKAAYGTWEFDLYKEDASTIQVAFINNQISHVANLGYALLFFFSEQVRLNRIGITVLTGSAASYIAPLTWYRIKITRTKDGEFYTYIEGGAFGNDFVLVDVSGGSGTNPATDQSILTSEYFSLDFDIGDRLTNLIITEGVQQ
jgi:hypothetical protein